MQSLRAPRCASRTDRNGKYNRHTWWTRFVNRFQHEAFGGGGLPFRTSPQLNLRGRIEAEEVLLDVRRKVEAAAREAVHDMSPA